jgi:hypothetical protein
MAMNFRPHEAVIEDLRLAAFITKRSANDIINEALRDWLDTTGKAAEAAYREANADASLIEPRTSRDDKWIEEWVGEPPPMGVPYTVVIDRWQRNPDGPDLRRIYAYELTGDTNDR